MDDEIDFDSFTAQVQAQRVELGLTDADFAGCENAGLLRTDDKRRALAALRERRLAAGVEPLPASY